MASSILPKGALWMQNETYPATWDRVLFDVLYANEGVIEGFAVTPGGGLDIDISAGTAIVTGDEVSGQGKYLVDSDAVVSLTLGSVGSNRTEYVYIAINDAAVAGGRAGDNVEIETSETLPTNSVLLLATLTLTSGTSTITSGMIADSRVYADVVAPGSITEAKLATGAVGSTKLADDAVINSKIGPGAVGPTELATGAVDSTAIADDAVINSKIGPGAVGSTELATLSVLNGKLANDAVGTNKIADGAVTGPKIDNDSIDSQHYVNGSIDAAHLANDAVTDAKAGAPTTTSVTAGSQTLYLARFGSLVFLSYSGGSLNGTFVNKIPSGYRPAHSVSLANGQETGVAVLDSAGTITTTGPAFLSGAWSTD